MGDVCCQAVAVTGGQAAHDRGLPGAEGADEEQDVPGPETGGQARRRRLGLFFTSSRDD